MTIDMGEVLRLTKAGRLADAVALLQGGSAPAPARAPDTASRSCEPGAEVIDMVAPARPGGSWTPPAFTTPEANPAAAEPPAKLRAVPDAIRSVLDRIGTITPGSGLPGLDTLPGCAPRVPPIPLPDGARFESRAFANAAGSRPYRLYVPSRYAGEPVPLVVMLHGCTQTPEDFAAGTRMNELAEEQGFLVAYPGQTKTAHPQRCWNWFSPGDQRRDRGEPSLIAGITRKVMAELSVDPARVFVAGMSAGGAAAAIMGAEYPDLYAAIGIHSGLACGSASDLPSAMQAMKGGGAVRARSGGSRPTVPTIVFHGDRDKVVSALNGDRIIADQAGPHLRTSAAEVGTESGRATTRVAHVDEAGREWLVQWTLSGAGHAWSGGSPAGSFTDPKGPDASREMLRFFAGHAGPAAR